MGMFVLPYVEITTMRFAFMPLRLGNTFAKRKCCLFLFGYAAQKERNAL